MNEKLVQLVQDFSSGENSEADMETMVELVGEVVLEIIDRVTRGRVWDVEGLKQTIREAFDPVG